MLTVAEVKKKKVPRKVLCAKCGITEWAGRGRKPNKFVCEECVNKCLFCKKGPSEGKLRTCDDCDGKFHNSCHTAELEKIEDQLEEEDDDICAFCVWWLPVVF